MAHDPVVGSPESSDLTSGSALLPPKNKHKGSLSFPLDTSTMQKKTQKEFDEVAYLGISSFDVVKCSLWQFDQLCVSHSMDSGGSWLSGQSLHLKHNRTHDGNYHTSLSLLEQEDWVLHVSSVQLYQSS